MAEVNGWVKGNGVGPLGPVWAKTWWGGGETENHHELAKRDGTQELQKRKPCEKSGEWPLAF